MRKMHLSGNPDAPSFAACGRHLGTNAKGRQTDDARRVGCLDCKTKPRYAEAVKAAEVAEEARFAAQLPHQVTEIYGGTKIVCRACGGDLFRDRPRSLDYHNHVCANPECGATCSTLTETGASR